MTLECIVGWRIGTHRSDMDQMKVLLMCNRLHRNRHRNRFLEDQNLF